MSNRMKSLKFNTLSTLLLEIVTLISGLIMPRLILSFFGSTSNGLVSSITQFLGFSTILRAGLGGAIYLVTIAGEFNGSVAGIGFLALAALIFGQWKPLGILGSTLFFGFATTIANVSQVIPSLATIPPVVLKVFPYVVTLLALIVFSKSSQAPKASGEPFDHGKR